jgi:hypothetical protein
VCRQKVIHVSGGSVSLELLGHLVCHLLRKETGMQLLKRFSLLVLSLAILHLASSIARANDVTDWNQHMLCAGTVGGTSPLVMSRVAAIVQASVFDAVNGIDRKYAQVHVPPAGPAGASRRAAASGAPRLIYHALSACALG